MLKPTANQSETITAEIYRIHSNHEHFFSEWFVADVGENCNDACQKKGLKCTNYHLHARNTDVDSSEKLIQLLKRQLGIFDWTNSCYYQYSKEWATPFIGIQNDHDGFRKRDICYHSSSSISKHYNCYATVTQVPHLAKSTWEKVQRLCTCTE